MVDQRRIGAWTWLVWLLASLVCAAVAVMGMMSFVFGFGRSGSYDGFAFGWFVQDGSLTVCWDRHPGFGYYPAEWFLGDGSGNLDFEMPYIDGDVVHMWSAEIPLWLICGPLGLILVGWWLVRRRRRRGRGAFPAVSMQT